MCFVAVLVCAYACVQHMPEDFESQAFGYLALGISVEVESEPASGRIATVNTDNFQVTIFQADGTEYLVIEPFSSAPPEVQLPVGEYYVEATSNDLVEAAFDSPYYFARSDNFTIDKEELKTIDIEAKLANCKVAINFSSEVTSVFDAYSGQVEVVSTGTTLAYAQGETREGYFVIEPLAVEVYLSYTKLDGTTIDRTFNTSIDDPQPATLYNINVDATLEDGQIVFNLTVDESVDTVNIDLGGSANPAGGTLFIDGSDYELTTAYFGCSFQPDLGFYDCQILFSDGEPDLCSGNQIASVAGIGTALELDQLTNASFDFSTNNGGSSNTPQEEGIFIWALTIWDIPGYDSSCEVLPGYTLYDTDINGTSDGEITFQKAGNIYQINFNYSFTGGPDITGNYNGPIINLN